MSYQISKTGEITIGDFDKGIATSPHKGIANMQNVNLATESGEVMASFGRVLQSQPIASGTLTQVSSNQATSTIPLQVGSWITIIDGGTTGLSGNYYILSNGPSNIGYYILSTSYSQSYSSAVSISSGTATFTTSTYAMGSPIASATEPYTDSNNTLQTRYYILDSNGYVWVSDTSTANLTSISQPLWFLPNVTFLTKPQGIGVLNGWLFVFYNGNSIKCKPTVNLGESWYQFNNGSTSSLIGSPNPHFVFTGHEGILYYTDGAYVGSIIPNNSYGVIPNTQSYAQYTASTTTGTISNILSGVIPATATAGSTSRIPALFFVSTGGTMPSDLGSAFSAIFWIDYTLGLTTPGNFQVFTASTGTGGGIGPLNLSAGAVGTLYYNTFAPGEASQANSQLVFTPQHLSLPSFEVSQSISELGTSLVVGCKGNVVYQWGQLNPSFDGLIFLPENNAVNIITVNNMGYIFAGQKGNIYITSGSAASLVMTVPDYCAGIPGSPSTYIEPYFTWGGVMYLRGRVYFSILDQVTGKAGNCGGIWSFIPTQNFFIGQDTGLSLRQENQSSYGNYNGVCTVLLPSQNQLAIAPQYWSGWYSSITNPLYGIDFTATEPVGTSVIETDLIPTGTLLNKETFEQIEYKLSSPLASGDSVAISYRQNSTGPYTTCGTIQVESSTELSGYVPINFEKGQWLQLKVTLQPEQYAGTSFIRLKEIFIR